MSLSNIRELYALSKSDKSIIDKKNQLYGIYGSWIKDYLTYYKYHIMREYLDIKDAFPDIDFSVEARVKSEHSYREKVDRKLSEGNTGRIYDIFANKIIVNSVNGITDEDVLIDACYRIEDFINSRSRRSITIPNKSKDFIKYPKGNGYQSIHLKRILQAADINESFFAETQIKTFRMREYEKTGEASHSLTYKSRVPLLNFIHTRQQADYYLPHYLLLVHNTQGNYLTVLEKSLEERFSYFFNLDFNDHMAQVQATKYELK